MQVLRKLPSLTIHMTLCPSHSQCHKFSLLGLKPLHGGHLQGAHRCPACLPAHLICTHTMFPDWFDPGPPTAVSQMSCSIKPFFHSAVTQEQPKLVSLKRDSPNQGTPWLLCPHSLLVHKSFSSPENSSPLVSLHMREMPLLFVHFVIQRLGSSWPLVLGSHPGLNLHLNLHLHQQRAGAPDAFLSTNVSWPC